MAKLPNPDVLERPSPRPELGVVQLRPSSGAEGAPGKALTQVGAALQQTGDELFRVVKIEEARVNKTRAEDAFNQLRNAQLDLTMGEQNGFVRKKGDAAVNKPLFAEYNGLFDEAAKRIEAGLANDQQKELFRERTGISRTQFQEGLLRHITHEGDQYAQQVFKGTMETEVRNVTSQWQDMNAVAVSLERMNAAIDAESRRSGWGPEITQATKLKEESRVHAAVIGQAIATNNYQFASQYYEANKGGIDLATAKTVEKAVEDGTQKQAANNYQASFLASRNDARGLAMLEAEVAKDPRLDDTRKNALLGRIQSRSEMLANRSERAQQRWERGIERQINTVNSITLQGYEPTAEQMLPLISATKGTPMEGQVRQMVATADATRKFRQMLPAQQEATLAGLEAQARKDPTKFDVQVVSRLRTIYDNQREQVRQDPQSFAVRQGFVEPVPLDISKPGEIGPQLAQRAELARQLRRDYQAPFRLLTNEETTLLSAALKNAAPQQKQEYFSGLARSTQGDREAYSAIMGQLAPDDPPTAIAGVYANGRSESRRIASREILRGQALLFPPAKEDGKPAGGKLVTMPPDAKLLPEFTSITDNVFAGRPEAQNAMFQSAKAIYAARTAEEGDTTGDVSSKRWKESVRLATGPVESYRGKPILLPESYDYARFRDALGAQARVLVASGQLDKSVTQERLLGMPLETVGDGRYVFRAGDGVLVDKAGQSVIINLNRRAD